MAMYQSTAKALTEVCFLNETSPDLSQEIHDVVMNTVSVIGEDPDTFDLMSLMQSHSDLLYAHSVAVSVYACMLAKHVGWESTRTLYKLSIAGIFHDVGKKELPKQLIEKPRHLYTADETALYETHPHRGMEIMMGLDSFPEDVVKVVSHHHEYPNGVGFPNRLVAKAIHPLAKPLIVANEFCDIILRNMHFNKKTKTSTETIDELLHLKKNDLDPAFFKALMEIFNYPVPEDMKKFKVNE